MPLVLATKLNVTFVDNFKQLNDKYSHEFGDKCIKAVGKMLCERMRVTDTVYHLSGDEFVIVASIKLPGSAPRVKHKALSFIEEINISYNGNNVPIHASIGHSVVQQGDTVTEVLERADKNLQNHKQQRLEAGLRTIRN